jgi:hypothetical protein
MLITDTRHEYGHLFMCTDTGFHGNCQNVAFNLNACCTLSPTVYPQSMPLTSHLDNIISPFEDSISSVDPDGYSCIIYM